MSRRCESEKVLGGLPTFLNNGVLFKKMGIKRGFLECKQRSTNLSLFAIDKRLVLIHFVIISWITKNITFTSWIPT